MYEKLTDILREISPDNSGKWIIDTKHKGTLDEPKKMPFVDYSGSVIKLINAVYETIDAHPELSLTQYHDILADCGLPLDGRNRPEDADVENWNLQGALALIVAIVRQDRFCEGLLKEQIEVGTVQRCLKRVKELDDLNRPKEESHMTIGTTVVEMRQGDITKVSDVEAIVNAANKSLLGGGGVDGAIHRAAGRELLEECRTLGGCETGEAKISKGYKLPCKYVIHTVGPIYHYAGEEAPQLLANCYWNSLALAASCGIRSVAFPSISTGVYAYPLEEAAEIAVKTVEKYVSEHPEVFDLVCWVLFDDRTKAAYDAALEKWK